MNSMSAEYEYPPDCSDESDSAVNVTWVPGDGVCPSTAEFNHCWHSKCHDWIQASSTHRKDIHTVQFYLDAFLDVHRDVPPFFQSPPKAVDISGRPSSYLMLKSSLRIKTTEDPDCDQPQKSIDYLQCLGSPTPVIYKVKPETQLQATIPVSPKHFHSGYFTTIVLAWSYIVSCRWVEILQQAGERSMLLHEKNRSIENSFWDITTHGGWEALIKRGKGTFYSPWMLAGNGTAQASDDYVPVTPNPSLAFDFLLEFCISEGLEYELLTALASVLLLTSRNAPAPSFASPRIPTALTSPQPRQKKKLYYDLLNTVDKCITLSSTQDALDSLACSAFFDPSIPCNLMGAASLGIKTALSTTNEIDNRKLLQAIMYTQPHLSLFWAAIVCSDLVTPYVNMTFYSLPPICLPAGFWTRTFQSFLQISYDLCGSENAVVPRVHEFQTSFYCRPVISVPWSPTPPFGQTLIENLSLEVRAHLGHMHTPLSWMTDWVLGSGEKVPATEQHPVRCVQVHQMYRPCFTATPDNSPYADRSVADEQSGMATSRLFNWHRSYDDGIWLDDGTRDMDQIRQLQSHPWIVDPFHETDGDEAIDTKPREVEVESILRWNRDVQRHRQSGETIEL